MKLKPGDIFTYTGAFARYYVLEVSNDLVFAANIDAEYKRAIAIRVPETYTILHRERINIFPPRVQDELTQLREET